MKALFAALTIALFCGSAAASEKSTVPTTFNVPITKWSDDFAGRYEFASPDVTFEIERGQLGQTASLSLVKRNGVVDGPNILVMVAYGGDWQFYSSAIFKGGEAIAFEEGSRKVLSCRGGCTMTESFFIKPTKAQLAKYGSTGNLTFQIRSKTATQAIITIPMVYFAAIQEAAK